MTSNILVTLCLASLVDVNAFAPSGVSMNQVSQQVFAGQPRVSSSAIYFLLPVSSLVYIHSLFCSEDV